MIFDTIKKLGEKMYVTLPLISTLLFASCQKTATAISEDSTSNAANSAAIDPNPALLRANPAKDYFKAIFFASGPLVQFIPEMEIFSANSYSYSSAYLNRSNAIEDSLMNVISVANGTFFAQFKADITSGNHVSIRNAINAGRDMLNPIVEQYMQQVTVEQLSVVQAKLAEMNLGLNPNDLEGTRAAIAKIYTDLENADPATTGEKLCLVFVLVLVALAAVDMFVYFDYWVDKNPARILSGSSLDGDELLKDQMINSIATNLVE